MPLSLSNAAQAWNAEQFLVWDPTTDTFGSGVVGRMKRIDPFVSLWNKASRRHNVFFTPGTDVSGVTVVRHNLSGVTFLLSPTFEQDAWQGGAAYTEMHRCHKVTPPSGRAHFSRPRASGISRSFSTNGQRTTPGCLNTSEAHHS
jgi:hypothetical protein